MQVMCSLTVSMETINLANTLLAGTAEPDVRVRVRRCIVQIQREHTIVRTVVPIATADQTRNC